MDIWMQKLTFNTKIGNQMQNLYCRNVRNVKFPKIVAGKFAFLQVWTNEWQKLTHNAYSEIFCNFVPVE